MKTLALPPEIRIAGQEPDRMFDVLILDDHATDRMRLRRLLRKAGLQFNLHEAESLTDFRAKIAEQPMDLVFLDYHLGADTGLDALKLLVSQEEQIDALPIMVTGVDRCDLAVEAMRSGCADYLIKDHMSVETIRKSVVSAFERKILITAIAEAQHARRAVRSSVARFGNVCGPEIRAVLAATLRHARSLRGQNGLSPHVTDHLDHLEQGCHEIFEFITDVANLLDEIAVEHGGGAERASSK